MKKEARLLLRKAVNSLILSVEQFNRPWDQGRIESVLIFLDHSFEMLLKASIVHRGGKIWQMGQKQTIGFDACVRTALTDDKIKFISAEQALTLQTVNGFRDAAQHHLLDLSEQHLYVHSQAGLTLFRDILKSNFGQNLTDTMPERVLPISTTPPTDIATLFDREVGEIKTLLKPGGRRQVEASAKLRGLAILETSIQGEKVQPGDRDLKKLTTRIKGGEAWDKIFPAVASINFTTKGYGPSLDLRITKKEGVPVQIVPEGTPGATTVAIKRVNELDFYSLSPTELAEKIGLTRPKALALIIHLNLKTDAECFKEIQLGKVRTPRYSPKALDRLKKELPNVSMSDIWATHGAKKGKRKRFIEKQTVTV